MHSPGLEYRGYDSAGIATVDNGKVCLRKNKGKVTDVIADCNIKNLPGSTSIGHVRWATHGSVTRENAHHHCDASSEIAVIHNGIIENFEKLKSRLVKKYNFKSGTDTELCLNLSGNRLTPV
jgi:glucosamine--fructose-6-phosphate aminotransferase (isomerizing)